MRTVDIPGGTATFREPSEMRGKDSDIVEDYVFAAAPILARLPEEVISGEDRAGATDAGDDDVAVAFQRVVRQMSDLALDPAGVRAMRSIRRASVIALLHSWTLDLPIPTTLDELADLPRDLIVALEAGIGGVDMDSLTGTDYSVSSDPKAPTGPSTSSGGPSTEDQLSTPTPSLSASTATTGTGPSTTV